MASLDADRYRWIRRQRQEDARKKTNFLRLVNRPHGEVQDEENKVSTHAGREKEQVGRSGYSTVERKQQLFQADTLNLDTRLCYKVITTIATPRVLWAD